MKIILKTNLFVPLFFTVFCAWSFSLVFDKVVGIEKRFKRLTDKVSLDAIRFIVQLGLPFLLLCASRYTSTLKRHGNLIREYVYKSISIQSPHHFAWHKTLSMGHFGSYLKSRPRCVYHVPFNQITQLRLLTLYFIAYLVYRTLQDDVLFYNYEMSIR